MTKLPKRPKFYLLWKKEYERTEKFVNSLRKKGIDVLVMHGEVYLFKRAVKK